MRWTRLWGQWGLDNFGSTVGLIPAVHRFSRRLKIVLQTKVMDNLFRNRLSYSIGNFTMIGWRNLSRVQQAFEGCINSPRD